jgi:UDP-N-acetylglucosamine 2-epimerase (non-hydrolysing)
MSRSWVVVVGTRPEVMKVQSVVAAFRQRKLPVQVWCTGQHSDLMTATLDTPRLEAVVRGAHRLECAPSGDPGVFADRVARAVTRKLDARYVAGVLVQGDTASAYGGAMGARAAGVRVGHIEAGVRTGDLSEPWPEEAFRVAIDGVAHWLFCPTDLTRRNVQEEEGEAWVTGQTGVDDLLADVPTFHVKHPVDRVLVTLHRRETLAQLPEVVAALDWVAGRRATQFVWPVHLNPLVQAAARGVQHLQTIPPMGARAFRRLLAESRLVVTDSGGVQEEAAVLGVPCLVARRVTDRPEPVLAGGQRVVGVSPAGVADAVKRELDAPQLLRTPFTGYGDGHAGDRIVGLLDH